MLPRLPSLAYHEVWGVVVVQLVRWNPRKGTQLKCYMGHGFEVLDAMGSCDNSQIASCGSDKAVVLWDVSSGQWNRKWRGHLSAVNCCHFNEDSSVIISGSTDTTVKVLLLFGLG